MSQRTQRDDLTANGSNMNLIDSVVNLPAELRRMVLGAILPSTICMEYTSRYCWERHSPPGDLFGHQSKKIPKTQDGPIIRLRYSTDPSRRVQPGLFHLSHHLITKAWYASVADYITTISIWDLGDADTFHEYLSDTDAPRYLAQQAAFLRSLGQVQTVALHLRAQVSVMPRRRIRPKIGNVQAILDRDVAISVVRMHVNDLAASSETSLEALALHIAMLLVVWNARGRGGGVDGRRAIKIACSEADYKTKQVQTFVEYVYAVRYGTSCPATKISWVHTGRCRYQGLTGDLTVASNGAVGGSRSTRRKARRMPAFNELSTDGAHPEV